ncbi:MAG: signal recognition particle-docking protein FtsY [Thermotogae bacterium]|nr:MAG: signal recognition particle-docking protein FtsY [Thermotogota bacterium]
MVFKRIRDGLSKARKKFFSGLSELLRGKKIDEHILEKLEETLITADVGFETTEYIVNKIKEKKSEDAFSALEEVLIEMLSGNTELRAPDEPPFVIALVGVNGTGKTTTAAKLASFFVKQGKSVVLAAADTFRAAAVEQLRIWGKRIGCTVISHSQGADAGAVTYDAINHTRAKKKDVVIIDTAGRLHTKRNLMEELKKITGVSNKLVKGAPHETLLVLDAVTGQNGLAQARLFKEMINVTGIIVTKLDGTAKGGITLAIRKELDLPIKFVGIGESLEDLKVFNAKEFVEALLED